MSSGPPPASSYLDYEGSALRNLIAEVQELESSGGEIPEVPVKEPIHAKPLPSFPADNDEEDEMSVTSTHDHFTSPQPQYSPPPAPAPTPTQTSLSVAPLEAPSPQPKAVSQEPQPAEEEEEEEELFDDEGGWNL